MQSTIWGVLGGPLGVRGGQGGPGVDRRGPGGDRGGPREVFEGSWGALGKGNFLFLGSEFVNGLMTF